MPLNIKRCQFFAKTLEKHRVNAQVEKKFAEFLKFKVSHSIDQFGGKDYSFAKKNILGGYAHAGLSGDISIFYKIANNNLYLYGIMTHDEAGIGQPVNLKKQQSLASKFSNQIFERKML